ncbi:NADPH-dependent diflavin oxidoreductase 1 [Anopheles marshallii]|uniref:NADPH-dependent diflavin oxidoreductase 1 n=1 Tax=Anopheles marshallii TaxID=1521116 RepID=UPI00237A543B|nr:NADPH-dependent diflavin oxidoreductase 1 [Anopheles marshallii]
MMERKLTILYGSQSGTAQDLAEQIWRESKMYFFRGNVLPMDEYDVSQLIGERFVVCVCSTYGQGEEPDNMKRFWKFLLRKNLPTDSLQQVHFAVLGLGDSRYPKFNYVAKKLHKRLIQLGGTALLPVGLCDDQHDLGYGAVFLPWIDQLWDDLGRIVPLPAGTRKLPESPREFRWKVEIAPAGQQQTGAIDLYADITMPNGFQTMVVENRRTTAPDHFQDVRMITFEKRAVPWSSGDVLYVRPHNSSESIDQLFELFNQHELHLDRDTVVHVKAIDSEMPVPSILQNPLPLVAIAEQYWDLTAIPRARAFAVLAKNCTNELEREKLIEFSRYEGQEELFAYANRPRRTILEVLMDFPHATKCLTLEALFELFQPIKPRAFSIASAVESGKLQILVAIIEYRTKLSVPRRGLCSNWLKLLTPGRVVNAWVRKSTFQLPADNRIPLVMIGPGTGLAPFRGILQERELSETPTSAPLVLFFGCRSSTADFHCEEDLKRMEQSGMLQLFCAFSRDQLDKVYVQHLIKKQGVLLKKLLVEDGGYVLVSGSSKNMPQAVKEALAEAIDDAQHIENMIQANRYQEETWA